MPSSSSWRCPASLSSHFLLPRRSFRSRLSSVGRSLPATLDARELEELQGIVRALAGLSLENAARVTITRKAIERAQTIGSQTFGDYLDVLRGSFEEQDKLLEALTT